ncbi:hypothetical protein L7F22_064435 [Adiantum nelumboides]|nr:hypothetical protein [Adiantum nelumboides]
MIFALHFVLLLLLSGDVLAADVHRSASEKQGLIADGKGHGAGGCQCMKSQNAEGGIEAISISRGSSHKKEICSCSQNFGLHQQVVVATYQSQFAYLSAHAHRPFHSLYARISVASTKGPMKHHIDSKIPSPFYVSRSKHDHFLALPPRGINALAAHFLAKAPNLETKTPTASPVPGPMFHMSRRRHHQGHHQVSLEPSPSPAPGPVTARSPAYRHPETVVSPSPDCSAVVCVSPLTRASFVSECSCVQPIEVELELSVPLYALFPIISVLAGELAEGALLRPNQVEVVGANTSGRNPEFSIVDANFLPLQEDFDILTAITIAQNLWKHEVILNRTLFGNYSVIYVKYPGLPPAPPTRGPVNGMAGIQKPLGVDVSKPKKEKLGTRTTAVIVLAAVIAMVICFGAAWLFFLKRRQVVAAPSSMPKLVFRKNILGGIFCAVF